MKKIYKEPLITIEDIKMPNVICASREEIPVEGIGSTIDQAKSNFGTFDFEEEED